MDAMRPRHGLILVPCALAAGLALAGCPRETRNFHSLPAENARIEPVRLVSLQPGAPQPKQAAGGPYEGNSWAISQGERLYEQYNCVGCHFHGGGGIGPPLMDPHWIYGGSGRNIHDTIVQGRPNGMPSYGGHIPDDQIWNITAYVRPPSGQFPEPTPPTRSDDLFPPRSAPADDPGGGGSDRSDGADPLRAADRQRLDRPGDRVAVVFQGAGHQADRPSVVVGGGVPGPASRPDGPDRQRDPHSRRPPGADPVVVERRHPQLLGAESPRQAGPDPRPRLGDLDPGRQAGDLPRLLRRVLRLPARPHGAAGDRRSAGPVRRL